MLDDLSGGQEDQPAKTNWQFVRTGLPVGVGIGSLLVTSNRNGEIGVLCVESDLAGVAQRNKT